MAASNQTADFLERLYTNSVKYEDGRTLRGFTRPVNRITRQLQRDGR